MALGQWGEDQAAAYLGRQGWRILERNWRCQYGELDIIAVDPEGELVAIEVKTRTHRAFGYAAETITPEKIRHIRASLAAYVRDIDLHIPIIRVDVIAVDLDDSSFVMRHFEAVDE